MAEYKGKSSGGGEGAGLGIVVFLILVVAAYIMYPVVFKGAKTLQTDFSVPSFGSSHWVSVALFVWKERVSWLYIFLDALLVVMIIYSCIKYWPMRPSKLKIFEKPTTPKLDAKKRTKKDPVVIKHWAAIVKKANTGTPENIRLAVLEADALVDYFLKFAGYEGAHMADRLSQILPDEVKSLEALWNAHRLRNDLVHTPGYVLTPQQAQNALMAYYNFLIELDAF